MVPALSALAQTAASPVPRLGSSTCRTACDATSPASTTGRRRARARRSSCRRSWRRSQPFRDRTVVVSGLAQHQADAFDDGANGDHTRGTSSWLTGVHPQAHRRRRRRNGISADQIAAAAIGKDTPLPSLELAHRSELPGRQLRERLQLRLPEHVLVAIADDAAADGEQSAGGVRAAVRRRRHAGAAAGAGAREPQHPRLGDGRHDAAADRLGAGDRATVDEYLDAVREVERRIQRAESAARRRVAGRSRAAAGIPEPLRRARRS